MSETIDTGTQPAEDTAVVTDNSTTPSETVEAQNTTEAPKTAANDAPKERPFYEKIIAADKSALRENKRQIEALQAQLQRQSQPQTQQTTQSDMVPMAEVERRAEMRATQITSEQAFVSSCNAVADAGAAKYADFEDAKKTFEMFGNLPRTFIETITDLGGDDGAKVFYNLGKDPNEAARVLSLTPAKMAMALAKMATATPPAKPVSNAPAPITPISSASEVRSGAEPDGKNDAEWRAWYNKQRKAAR